MALLSANLRAKGIPASVRSTKTAFSAAKLFNQISSKDNYPYLKDALAAIYAKNKDQREEFEQVFQETFPEYQPAAQVMENISDTRKEHGKNQDKSSHLKLKQNSFTFKKDSKDKQIKMIEDDINFKPPIDDYPGLDLRENSLMELDINHLDFYEVELFELCQKLGRKIANHRARRYKQAKINRIDIRKSIRKNLKYGGALIELEKSKPNLKKNRHFFLSDVSGSCDWVSNWFFCILFSAQKSFKQSRFFDFDNKAVETTVALSENNLMDAFTRVRDIRQKNIMIHGTSNMYTAFYSFIEQTQLNHKSVVLILSDCRDWAGPKDNGRPSSSKLIEEMCQLSKKVMILNPEPEIKWNVVDSCVSDYENAGAQIKEVRNLKQLARLVEYI